ncbi:MAG: hypothetical protein E6G62_05720 [Actinobacteria bacterium]|nr:MAG: hypothetical protein E6G62_05720 [Actinomycetota bacterium]
MGPADRLPCCDARLQLAFVELEAELAQRGGHAHRALLAIGEELGETLGQQRARVVDVVAEDVQFATRRCAVVDGGDLHGRNDAQSQALSGAERLGDAAHRVVVGEGEQLDPARRRALDDLRCREGAVGVC